MNLYGKCVDENGEYFNKRPVSNLQKSEKKEPRALILINTACRFMPKFAWVDLRILCRCSRFLNSSIYIETICDNFL